MANTGLAMESKNITHRPTTGVTVRKYSRIKKVSSFFRRSHMEVPLPLAGSQLVAHRGPATPPHPPHLTISPPPHPPHPPHLTTSSQCHRLPICLF